MTPSILSHDSSLSPTAARPFPWQHKRRQRRLLIALSVMLTFIASAGLYQLKYKVEELHDDLARLQQQLDDERANVKVLTAEWEYLASPQHLNLQMKRVAALGLTRAHQVAARADLDQTLVLATAPAMAEPVESILSPAAAIPIGDLAHLPSSGDNDTLVMNDTGTPPLSALPVTPVRY